MRAINEVPPINCVCAILGHGSVKSVSGSLLADDVVGVGVTSNVKCAKVA